MNVFHNTAIYIFCPAKKVTGGPEALHQLRWYLDRLGYQAFLVYYRSEILSAPERYLQYEPKIISYKEVIDEKQNIIIVPENETHYLRYYKNVQKAIWWLSYLAYDGLRTSVQSAKRAVKNCIKFVINPFCNHKLVYRTIRKPAKLTDEITHLCGSKFAFDMIQEKLHIKNPIMLVEPISKDFLDYGMFSETDKDTPPRTNLIAYNPAKPSEIMQKLLNRTDLDFFPLKGMTPTELAKFYRTIKLYVDFGTFPGPERIPKEAVYNGACILVGKRNAAANDFDVAIPEKYKIADYNDEELVVTKIKEVLENYDTCISDFDAFREKIDHLENNFIISIQEIFVKIS